MFSKISNILLMLVVWLAVCSTLALASAAEADTERMEDSTVSPIADMAIIESEMKTSTERPPIMESAKEEEKPSSQRHTVADFIIHPLIAFKPRNPEEEVGPVAGKQAASSTSSTTPSPWQLFGFNAGQGLGSSVSSLAGSVTGWINDRIQLPGLMETPVRESTTSSTTSTTTTTPRPDVVVRVQHKASTRRPLISISDRNRPNRPNRPNFDSEENNDDEDDDEDNEDNNENEDNESSNEVGDNEASYEEGDGDNSEEDEDNNVGDKEDEEEEEEEEEVEEENFNDDEEENQPQRPNNKRRPLRNGNKNSQRKGNRPQNTRRRVPNRRQQPLAPGRRRPVKTDDDSSENVLDDDYSGNDPLYYATGPSTRRSQSNSNFIQRGQQQLINQIRQLTRGQTPAQIGSAIRKAQVNNAGNRRRQQATLFVNRNGQTIYLAPELAQFGQPQYQVYAQPLVQKPPTQSVYPQPPLTVPLKRKGQPVQYITIPWSQLGISPPNNLVSLTEGIQSQPLILNIPQSAINTMQNQARPGHVQRKKKRPQLITAEAVPLLAEASLMDIFKPPQIPPSRTSSTKKPSASVAPVLVASRPSSTKTSSPLLQQHIRPGTIVEKAPNMDDTKKQDESETSSSVEPKNEAHRDIGEKQYILVGNDDEPGLIRQVEPVFGDARYVRLTGNSQFFDVFPRRRFTVRRGGRELTLSQGEKTENIPVEIINEADMSNTTKDQQPPSQISESVSQTIENMESVPESAATPIAQAENTQNTPETTT